MLAYKLFGSGLNTLTVASITDVATGLTATGSSVSDAYQVTYARNAFSTVGSGTGAILDSNSSAGDSQLIYNGGSNALRVYPTTGASINNLAANAPTLLAPRTAAEFHKLSATAWTALLSA